MSKPVKKRIYRKIAFKAKKNRQSKKNKDGQEINRC